MNQIVVCLRFSCITRACLHVMAVNALWEEEPASEPEPELEMIRVNGIE